jgi:hypothetical protein
VLLSPWLSATIIDVAGLGAASDNLRSRPGGASATLDDVVEVGVLPTNPTDFAGMNEEYATWFAAEPPARYVAKLGVAQLPAGGGPHSLTT